MNAIRMATREFRDNVGRRISAAQFGGEVTIVTKSGEPHAVLVPHAWYEARNRTPTSGTELVNQAWPYDGPHSPTTVSEAAAAVDQLVRYLANATQYDHTQPDVSAGYRLTGHLGNAARRLGRVIALLSVAAERHGQDPTLFDERGDRPGSETAAELVAQLDAARPVAEELARLLGQAASTAGRLGHNTEE